MWGESNSEQSYRRSGTTFPRTTTRLRQNARGGAPGSCCSCSWWASWWSALGVGAFYIGRGLLALNSIERDHQLNPTDYQGRPAESKPKPVEPGQPEAKAPINFVLMGSDSRGDGDGGRSDSLMVAHVTGDRQAVYLVSFPRDMWVDIPGRGKGKLNWAYAFGGPQLTVRTLEQMTGVRMDHTVLIDFEGFIRLTEAVGGVTVYNPWASEQDAGNRYEKGEITIEGERALGYVRERYSLPNGDLDRAFRQRTVVKAIIKKIMTPETLINPVTFSNVVGRIADTMVVDEAMTSGYVTDLALDAHHQWRIDRVVAGAHHGLLAGREPSGRRRRLGRRPGTIRGARRRHHGRLLRHPQERLAGQARTGGAAGVTPRPRVRWWPGALFAALLVPLAWVVLRADGWSLNRAVVDVWSRLRQLGYPGTPESVGALLNVVLFVPFGLLAAVSLPRVPWWVWVFLGCASSVSIEAVQWLMLPREADVWDVVANTAGAAVGAGLGEFLNRRAQTSSSA